jgi:hypothetical protein
VEEDLREVARALQRGELGVDRPQERRVVLVLHGLELVQHLLYLPLHALRLSLLILEIL